MAVSAYEMIRTETVASSVASVVFSDIPQIYTDLVAVANPTSSSGTINLRIRFNNDSTSLYSETYVSTTNDAGTPYYSSNRLGNQTQIEVGYYVSTSTTAGRTTHIYNVFNYTNTNVYKTVLSTSFGNPSNSSTRTCSLYRSTSAITRIDFIPSSANFAAGSTFTLYGIKAAL